MEHNKRIKLFLIISPISDGWDGGREEGEGGAGGRGCVEEAGRVAVITICSNSS